LNVPRPARSYHRVRRRYIRRVEDETKRSGIGRVNKTLCIGIRKMRMVQYVEELPAQLHAYPLVQIGRLDNGEVQIVQPRAAEGIKADVRKCATRRLHMDLRSLHITCQLGKL